MMRAVIVEDETKNIVKLKSLLATYCPKVQLVGVAANADQGVITIVQTKPDLVFLDIHLPLRSGFDMLAEIGSYEFEVIFVTAFDQYGIQAIKFSALDYILKPIKPKELVLAVEKASQKTDTKKTAKQIANLMQQIHNDNKSEHRIILPSLKENRYLYPSEIIRCEAMAAYTNFHLENGEKLTVSSLLKEYDEMLTPYNFIRCHQSHLVNRKYVKSLTKGDGVSELLLVNKVKIPISRMRKEMVIAALEQ